MKKVSPRHIEFQSAETNDEIERLKKQIEELNESIQCLERDSDLKERAIGTLARDKERLASELRKERRSTTNLRQQLEDERHFYLKEKQTYCHEMNECKRNRKKWKEKNIVDNLRDENLRLKSAFEEAIQTNYNLCVKFLRMKNTKDDIKKRFTRYQDDQSKMLEDLAHKLSNARDELETVISEQFQQPLSLSNKKFLEIVKRNNQLIHENLCLKVQLDNAINEIERLKSIHNKSETKLKYPYIIRESRKCRTERSTDDELNCKIKKTVRKDSNTQTKCSVVGGHQLIDSSSSITTSYTDLMRAQSAPSILLISDFKQIKSSSTQT